MSICMYARVKNKSIDEQMLRRIIEEYYLSMNSNNIIMKTKNIITYEVVYEDDKVAISFVNKKKAPYNIYDSSICNGEFQYTQLIVFDINKEYAYFEQYDKILDFCIHLQNIIQDDILITSDVHNEICLLREGDVIWSTNYKR